MKSTFVWFNLWFSVISTLKAFGIQLSEKAAKSFQEVMTEQFCFLFYARKPIFLAVLFSINYRCSFHDRFSLNSMSRNFIDDCPFITCLLIKSLGNTSVKSFLLLADVKLKKLFFFNVERELIWKKKNINILQLQLYIFCQKGLLVLVFKK